MRVFITTFIFVASAAYVWGYSGGAPEDVCEDMLPKHPVDPQKSAFPYTVVVDKPKVSSDGKVHITISGGKPFKGYLLQVRDGDKAVGTFNIDGLDKYSKSINCFGKKEVYSNALEKHVSQMIKQFIHLLNSFASRIVPVDLNKMLYNGGHLNNAATHKNSADKKSVTLEWSPPAGVKKTYTVYATVAENGGVFWVRKPTAKINVH